MATALRSTRSSKSPPRRKALWALVAVAAAIVVAVLLSRDDDVPSGTLRIAGPTLVTRAVGIEDHPAWSPGGETFAYSASTNPNLFTANWDVWVSQVRGEQPLNRTAEYAGDDRYPAWSPDGSQIAFFSARSGNGIYVMPALAGGARRLSGMNVSAPSRPQWSPDGEEVAYTLEDDTAIIEILSVATGVEILSASFSANGKKVAYSKGRRISNVWRVPLLEGRVATWNDAQQITQDEAFIEFIDVSPDGTELTVSSDRSGVPDLWILPSSGGELRSLTTDPAPDWHPDYSPDGKEIVFYAYRSGNRDLWVMPAEGGAARQLTFHEERDSYPAWSPDGTRIAFDSYRGGDSDIWVLTLASGEMKQVTAGPRADRAPTWSPDGKRIVFDGGDGMLWRVPAEGGEPESLGTTPANLARFTPDGRNLLVTNINDGTGNVWSIDPETKIGRPVTDLGGRAGGLGQIALATDGVYIYYTWMVDTGDIWVADVVDES